LSQNPPSAEYKYSSLVYKSLLQLFFFLRNFRLPPRSRWELCSSGLWRSN